MQSEIDEIRACTAVVKTVAGSEACTEELLLEAMSFIERELEKIELQQAHLAVGGMVTLPVMTLAQVAQAAARAHGQRLTLIEGGRQ